MARRLALAIAAALALGGCCHDFGSHVPISNAHAEFGLVSKLHHVKRARLRHISNTTVTSKAIPRGIAELSKSDPDSKEAAPDTIDSVADDELRQKLIICRGCTEQPAPEDLSGSIWPTPRLAERYMSIQRTLRSLSLPVESSSSSGLR
jgi:hypothetical protein